MYICKDKYPGPIWEPFIWDGIYPLTAEPGDIYINRYTNPPLYYLFTTSSNCKMIDREEVKSWHRGGLMKVPLTQGHTKNQPSRKSSKPLVIQ